jgi:hypothetical protein
LLIAEPRGQRLERAPEEGQAACDAMLDFAAGLRERGPLIAVESLASDQVAFNRLNMTKIHGRQGAVDEEFDRGRQAHR